MVGLAGRSGTWEITIMSYSAQSAHPGDSFTPVWAGQREKISPCAWHWWHYTPTLWPAIKNPWGNLVYLISGSVEGPLVATGESCVQTRVAAGVCNVNFVTQLGPDCLSIMSLKHSNFLPFSHVKFFVTGGTWNSFAGSTTGGTQTSEQNVLGWKTKESYMLCCTKIGACFYFAVLDSWFGVFSFWYAWYFHFLSSLFLKVIKRIINILQRKKKAEQGKYANSFWVKH